MPSLRPGLLPIISLIVVIAWALFAVLMLTGTLVSANQIDNRVTAINKELPAINQDLGALALAKETGQIAGQIDQVVKPIGPQFTQIVQAVDAIQGNVDSVLDRANEINASVKTINDAVSNSIKPAVVSIGGNLTSVGSDVKSINDSAHGIDNRLSDVLDHVRSIDDGAAGINHRAERVTDIARSIRDDLDRTTKELLPDILQNSASIKSSPLLDPLNPRSLNPLLAGLLQQEPKNLLNTPNLPLRDGKNGDLVGVDKVLPDSDSGGLLSPKKSKKHRGSGALGGLLG